MFYLSQVLGSPVEEANQAPLGKLIDVLVAASALGQQQVTPVALVVEGPSSSVRVPLTSLATREPLLRLHAHKGSFPAYTENEAEIALVRDILDKQVIDLEHKRAVRVNDICFEEDWHILGLDDSASGLWRRIFPAWLSRGKRGAPARTLLRWDQMEPIEWRGIELSALQDTSRRVSKQLADLRPADLAEIVHQLSVVEGARLIERLDDEAAADTMEEIATERQMQIISNLPADRAADILQTMGPDEAADLLEQLGEEEKQDLLALMTPEESEDVRDLLEHAAHTAGGMMTTDFVSLEPECTVSMALDAVRKQFRRQKQRVAVVYCVRKGATEHDWSHILGIVPLWNLLLAEPSVTLESLMDDKFVWVAPDAAPQDVAQLMAKYNLFEVPVVNAERELEGIVTVDDALDILLPAERRRQPRRMY
jgi:CBS domain-containing protein